MAQVNLTLSQEEVLQVLTGDRNEVNNPSSGNHLSGNAETGVGDG